MTFWIILVVAAALASSAITILLVRRHDRWRQHRALNPPAPRMADQGTRLVPEGTWPLLVLGPVGVAVFLACAVYVGLGRPGPSGQAAPPPQVAAAAPHPMGDVASMIAGLENKLKQAPNDAESWQMLGWSYMRTSRPADAAKAYGRAVALSPRNSEYLSAEGEALVQAEGKISPEAASLFRRALGVDPADPRTRYFLAMLRDQNGDHAGAMKDWVTLIKSAPPDAPWLPLVRNYAVARAREQGIDLAAQLPAMPKADPPAAAPPATAQPGPTQADVTAAAKMSDSDRQAMIRGMVEGLAARLKSDPHDAQGWIRLMRARMVLGDKTQAMADYRAARKAFANSPSDQTALEAATKSLNLSGG